jgi:benzil reductase ((S)-benzoin forming)
MFVITGGGSGLGRALALTLAQRQQPVLIVGRHQQTLEDTATMSPLISYCCADVTLKQDRARIYATVANHSLQGVIHNAGIIDPIVSMATISEEGWQQCMTTNVTAPLFLTQTLLPLLHTARVLHIGSGAAYFPIKGWSAYCASKAALAMITRNWRIEEPDLLIASVMPGIIDTPMQATIRHAEHMDPEKHEFFCDLKETGGLLSPETVAEFLTWLLLDVSAEHYVAQEWDIYDTSHHARWLRPPHSVPPID